MAQHRGKPDHEPTGRRLEHEPWWVIGTETEAERQELSGGDHHYLQAKSGRREFLPGAGRPENHTSWARFHRFVRRFPNYG